MALSVRPRGGGGGRGRSHRYNNHHGGGQNNGTCTQKRIFRSRDHCARILANLSEQRDKGRFCDVELVLEGKSFGGHRAVLAASSPYFEAMFSSGLEDSQQKKIEIHDVTPSIFELLMSFIYKGEIHINQENCQDILSASNMLGLSDVVHACCEFLQKELHPSNCVGRSPVSTKRRRVAITAGDKRDICKWKRDHPQASLGDLLSWIQNSLGMDVPKSTLSDILREAPKWLKVTAEKEHLTRALCGKQTQLEAALVEWLSEGGAKGGEVSDLALVQKARALGGSLGIPSDFGYSRGWLHRFKMRQGLARTRNLLGLASFPPILDDPSVEQVRSVAKWNELRKLLARYDPEDVYNLDETGLFYQLAPSETGFTGPAEAQDHPRLTLVLVCNATGRDKATPLVLCGTSKRATFGGCFAPSLYCDYRSTPGGVMSPQVFRDVAKRLDRALRLQGRRAVLLVDRSPPHSTTPPGLTNLVVHHLPPNSVALQPLETGIFMSVKAYYRRDLVRHYVANAAEGRPLAVTLRRALQMVRHAWSCVSPRTIRKCWLHTGILAELAAHHDSNDILDRAAEDPEGDIPLIELQQLIGRLNGCGGVSAADYVAIDDELQTSMHWEPALGTSDSGEVEEEDDGEEVADVGAVPPPTLREAVEGVGVAIAFLEQLGEAEHLGSLWTVLRTLEGKYLRRPKRVATSPSGAPQVQTSFGSGLSCDGQGLRERV